MMAEAEDRLPELRGHGERTASFAVATAHHLGVDQNRLSALRIAAALHFVWTPCCAPETQALVRGTLPENTLAADMIRSMHAQWNMAPLEPSILAAACRHDLANVGIDCADIVVRPGVTEALQAIAPLVTPLDYVR
jgi:hypothetical protein